jgi:hypothetical protein
MVAKSTYPPFHARNQVKRHLFTEEEYQNIEFAGDRIFGLPGTAFSVSSIGYSDKIKALRYFVFSVYLDTVGREQIKCERKDQCACEVAPTVRSSLRLLDQISISQLV